MSDSESANTLRNFKLQANGAEMLRIAAIAITERGIRLCAMIHDAVLVEAPESEIDDVVVETRRQMAAASRAILNGFEIGTDAEVIRFPSRFEDFLGKRVWELVLSIAENTPTPGTSELKPLPLQIEPPV